MPQKNAQDRLWKILTPVLLVLAVLAMAKTLFVGLEIDEEYAFSLGFRLVKGDRLFYTMWEPHQLSALPAALVLALYTAIAGTTTGALLFVRAVVLVCKAAMSAVFYHDFKQTIGRHGALLSAVVLFVYTPKWFLGPDYISQQFHFTVAAFLCFYHYYTHGFRRPWLVVLGAVCACFSFLAFPQSALAAAVIFIGMVLLGRRGKEPTICKIPRGAVLFVLGCMACAAAFLAYVLPGMGLTAFLQRVSLILNDPQYDFYHKPAAGPVGKPGTDHRQIPGKAAGRQRGALSAVVGQNPPKTGLDRPCPEPLGHSGDSALRGACCGGLQLR